MGGKRRGGECGGEIIENLMLDAVIRPIDGIYFGLPSIDKLQDTTRCSWGGGHGLQQFVPRRRLRIVTSVVDEFGVTNSQIARAGLQPW